MLLARGSSGTHKRIWTKMPLSLASNIESLRAQRQVAKTTAGLSKSFERLSSGLRISKASDDPAGLALADSLRRDIRLAAVAVRNANDGLSLTAIADSALSEVTNILQRMAELAEQSINGTFTHIQRSAMSFEFNALGSEIERIARVTTFNDLSLLSNSADVTLQVGIDGTETSRITVRAVLGTLSSLNIGNAAGALTFSIIDVDSSASQSAAQKALNAVNAAIDSVSSRRGFIGAAESRLSTAVEYLQVARENYAAAESQIRDVDVAEEVANMVKLQVLQQAGIAVLAQANQQPAIALRLLE